MRFTEDAKELPVGDGLWKTATKLRPFRTDFLDPQTGTAAVHAVVEESGTPVLLAARLRVVETPHHGDRDDRRAQSAGRRAVRARCADASVARDDDAAARGAAHAARRDGRDGAALSRRPRVGSFEKSDVPFAPTAYRFENGVRMAGPGCTFQPPSCENMRSQRLPTLAGIVAHVVAVDEENGTVLLWMDFGPGSLPGPPDAPPRSLVTFEAFKIYGGQVHAVEAMFEGMPNGTASGWR